MIFREKTFKRVTCIILAALIAIPGAFPVYAEKEDTDAGQERRPALTLNKKESKETYRDKELENTVVVMFKDDSEVTKKEAKKTLESGDLPVDDIRVSEVWNFQTDDPSDGLKLDSDEESYANVALVRADSMSAGKLAMKLRQRDDIRYAERNHKIHALKVSDDEYSDFQWSMQDPEKVPNAPNIGFEWNTKNIKGAEDKIVAVVDSGIDYTNPDLKDNLWKNTHYPKLKGTYGYDFINGDGDPMDDNGHGSHCAGIIGAVGDNGIGISGVNQKVKIMALKILDYEGSAMLSHEIAAYNYINDALDLGEPIVAVNNSWGGGEESDIMKELVDLVGSKGAISVCAAGNGGYSSDENPEYPSNIDSEYIVSVGATTRKGELAEFSNYGESVDITAPGADILSTVSYNSYLPMVYDDEKQGEVSEKYNDFDDDENTWGVPDLDKLYVNGVPYSKYIEGFESVDEEKRPQISCRLEGGNVLDDSGKHVVIDFKNMEPDALVCMPLKYTLSEDYASLPHLSLMASIDGPEDGGDFFGQPLFGFIEGPADSELTIKDLGQGVFQGTGIMGESNHWTHISVESFKGEDPVPGAERQFVMTLYAYEGGDYTARLDNLGISSQDVTEDEFGKYDIYSGTSMAAPYISGSIALKTAEAEKEGNAKPEATDIINEITQMVKPTEPALPTASGGLFNFAMLPEELAPRISKVTVDTARNEIKIWGSGFAPKDTKVKVEIGNSDADMKQAVIKEQNTKYIVVENDGWINNMEDIKVTAFGPKPAVKKNVYLVKGKKQYTENKNVEFTLTDEAVTTDGRYIYNVNSTSGELTAFDTAVKEDAVCTVGTVNTDELFKGKRDSKKKYAMLFGKDIAYLNKAVYALVEYGPADEIEPSEEDVWILSNGQKKAAAYGDDDDDTGDEGFDGPYSIFSGEFRLVRFDTGTDAEEPVNLGKLPEALEKAEGYTMAAYNGKLYFIGGHSHKDGDQDLTAQVVVYDPVTKKWSTAANLPEARADGKALQYGNRLVYTLSHSAEGDTASEIYDLFTYDDVSRKWNKIVPENKPELFYKEDVHSINIVKDGILFTGGAAKDYGDTFIFNFATGKYVDTGYNYISEINDQQARMAAAGSRLYAFNEEGKAYTMPIKSGFVKISGTAKGNGKISGTGWLAPGNDARVTVKAGKNCHIKSIKVGTKAVAVKKNASRQVVTIRKPLKDQTVSVVFAKNKQVKVTVSKKGKGKVTGAGKYYVGKKVKIKVTAAKKYYIKSFKVGKKAIKLKGKTTKKVYTIKKIKKNTKVKVVFAKKKSKAEK